MNEAVKLQLSAMVDAELGPDEARFLLRRVESEPELSMLWTRYHIAGECLRRQAVVPVSAGFSARLMQALPQTQSPSRSGRWLRMGVGSAIAASVAVAALVLVRPPSPSAPPGDGAVPLAATTRALPVAAGDGFAPDATNNYSLLLRDPSSPRLDVEPASAVVSPGYFALQPVGYVRQRPSWMQGGALYARPRTSIFTGLPTEAQLPARAASATVPQARNPAGR